MKKFLLVFLLLICGTVSSVQALSWAYPFVVWGGNVYEVTDDVVNDSQLGKRIGKVKTKPNDMTGNYYGNASNYFPVGTPYYEISGIPTSEAIAVEADDGIWLKADYANQAPFHWMNVGTHPIFFVILCLSVVLVILYKWKKPTLFALLLALKD